ncbi:hypothetical protein, partial [Coleofasciculus sp. G2-EDA-02]|uniref:hypothetical protein n=1 Tax=Coleofasciculus sp. G2-EDA-02 TaxID=3069529 RepID=UPI00330241C0
EVPPIQMYCAQAKALYRNGLSAQALKNRTHVALAKIARSRYFCNRQEIGENPRYIKVSAIVPM